MQRPGVIQAIGSASHASASLNKPLRGMQIQLCTLALSGGKQRQMLQRRALAIQVSLERKAFLGALRCLYWLAKEEVAHTTKFKPLLELAISLGCGYLKSLNKVSVINSGMHNLKTNSVLLGPSFSIRYSDKFSLVWGCFTLNIWQLGPGKKQAQHSGVFTLLQVSLVKLGSPDYWSIIL